VRRALALAALLALAAAVQARPRGGRIDLDVVQADLRDVARLLAEVGGVNLVLGDEVTGRVTTRLKRVRWDLALRTLLRSRGYEVERTGSIWRVAAGKTLADERDRQLGAHQRCVQAGPLRTMLVRPSNARAADLAAHLRQTLSPRGTVTVDERTNTLVVRDVVCN
jgi:type IV pilus assembly protein PilQ